MTKQFQVYQCDLCSQVIEVLHAGSPSLVCCGQPMRHLAEGTSDASKEKHVPVLSETPAGCKVSVGSVPHPMVPEHWIDRVEVVCKEGKRCKKFLNPGDAPEVEFMIPFASVVQVREHCNLHGVWKA